MDPYAAVMPSGGATNSRGRQGNRDYPMLFNSWEFLCLVAVVLPLYYLPFPVGVRRLWQVLLLLSGSAAVTRGRIRGF